MLLQPRRVVGRAGKETAVIYIWKFQAPCPSARCVMSVDVEDRRSPDLSHRNRVCSNIYNKPSCLQVVSSSDMQTQTSRCAAERGRAKTLRRPPGQGCSRWFLDFPCQQCKIRQCNIVCCDQLYYKALLIRNIVHSHCDSPAVRVFASNSTSVIA